MKNSSRHGHILLLLLISCLVLWINVPSVAGDSADSSHNCRLWGMVSQRAPHGLISEQLSFLPSSLENLSHVNIDGWGIAYYIGCRAIPTIFRGRPPAYSDGDFDTAVARTSLSSPSVAVAHIRRCSSGLCGIPDPHPFERIKNGRHWLLAHNGSGDKGVILGLIRPEYLAANPPQNGGDDTLLWIDSELYFIFILQTLEDFNWEVKPALGHVIEQLRLAVPEGSLMLNFYLTDGTTLWAYREGNTLFYKYDSTGTPYSVVASQYPSATQEDWIEIADGQLVTLSCENPPVAENIQDYFGLKSVKIRKRDPVKIEDDSNLPTSPRISSPENSKRIFNRLFFPDVSCQSPLLSKGGGQDRRK